MTDLSPAAQAVMDAFYQAPVDNKLSVAAALRAAAGQLGYGDGSGDPIINEHELLAIADELEAE
jgi:CHAT domain-containing protein